MYTKTNRGWLKHLDFELIDILALEIAYWLTYFIRHKGIVEDMYLEMYIRVSIVIVVIDIATLFFSDNYKGIIQRLWQKELIAVIQHVSTVNVVVLFYLYLMQESELMSRTVFILLWPIGIFLSFGARLAWKRVIRKRIKKDKNQIKLLLLSTEQHAVNAIKEINNKAYREYKICGIAVPDNDSDDVIEANIPILYGKKNVIEYIKRDVVDAVYIDTFKDKDDLQEWIDIFLMMGITVHIGMGFLPDNLPNRFIGTLGSANVVTTTINFTSSWKMSVKRAVDVVGALVGLIITGIAYIFVAPAIKHASPGPVFFAQERVGRNGRIFKMYKFRSMYVGAEKHQKELQGENEMRGLMFKMEDDPRIIGSEKGPGKGLGNFIRKTSIDELPQFWNVLKGDMSLVGTRPPTKEEFENYDISHKVRLSMKPGITGLWQVSGRNKITDFEQVVKYDTEYIENWGFYLDFYILCKTIKVVFTKDGSK